MTNEKWFTVAQISELLQVQFGTANNRAQSSVKTHTRLELRWRPLPACYHFGGTAAWPAT